ncbi:MAG: hypothetical protein AAF074_15565 [Pseudomonadota bacterium]
MYYLLTYLIVAAVAGFVLLGRLVLQRVTMQTLLTAAAALLAAAGLATAFATEGLRFEFERHLVDVWFLADAIKKVEAGYQPHLDFFSPIGPAFFWVFAAALQLGEASIVTIVQANALFAAFAAAVTVGCLARRASAFVIALAVLVAVGAAISPREENVTFPIDAASFLAPYNRWGWALLVPVALRFCLPAHRVDWPGAVLAGVAIALLLLLKVTYGIAALGLLVCGSVLRRQGWRDGLFALLGCAAVLAVVALSTGLIGAYIADLQRILSIQAPPRLFKLFRVLGESGLYASAALLFLALLDATERPTGLLTWPFRRWQPILLIGACASAGVVVLMQNHPVHGAALAFLTPLIAYEWWRRYPVARAGEEEAGENLGTMLVAVTGTVRALAFVALFAVVARTPLLDVSASTAQMVYSKRDQALPELAGTPMQGLYMPSYVFREHPDGRCYWDSCRNMRTLFNGLALLREAGAGQPGQGAILPLTFSNPYPMLMGAAPPRYSSNWYDAWRNITDTVHVPAETLFSDVEFVMIRPTETRQPDVLMQSIYLDYVEAAFEPAGENAFWKLYRRRANAPDAAANEPPA